MKLEEVKAELNILVEKYIQYVEGKEIAYQESNTWSLVEWESDFVEWLTFFGL